MGTICSSFENYPVDRGSYYYLDEYDYDPDKYIIYRPYGCSLMNKINGLREIYGLRPLLTREDDMELADWRVDDLIYCHITNRRGLDVAYDAVDIYPTLYAEYFIQGAASPDEALAILFSNEACAYELMSEEYRHIAISCGVRSEGSIAYWAVELYR